MMKIDQAITVYTGDIHANSTTALMPPIIQLDDGGQVKASKLQRWVWGRWVAFHKEVAAEKARLGWPVFVILNGEIADDNHHATTQLITKNPADQLQLAVATLQPLLDVADYIFVTRGTAAHSGPSSAMDEIIAHDIGAIPNKEGNHSWWNWRGEIAGVRMDVAHHPGTGHARPWTRGADANRLAAMITYRYAEREMRIPHLVIRGHNHKYSDSFQNHPCRAVILPSWQLTTDFGHRLGGDWLPVGAAYALCDRGSYDLRVRQYHFPLDKAWTTAELEEEPETARGVAP